MQRLLLSAILLLTFGMTSSVHAYDFCVDDIYYDINEDGTTCSVTFKTNKYNSYAGDVVIPTSVVYDGKTYKVTCVGESAFSACSSLFSVKLPSTLTILGSTCFQDCSNLEDISLPSSVDSIGYRAFANCSSLVEVAVNGKVKYLPSGAFHSCESLRKVVLPEGLLSIGYDAFNSCSSLTDVNLPSTTRNIGQYAFSSCKSLTSILLPSSLTKVDSYAFQGCTSVTEVKVLCPTMEAGFYSFRGVPCEVKSSTTYYKCPDDATSVVIPQGISKIAYAAFMYTNVESVDIPSSVKSIGKQAFSACPNLSSLTIPEGVTEIEYGTFSNASILDVSIPSTVRKIGDNAFEYCKLKTINIPSGVTEIGSYAFSGCREAGRVVIPASVTSIGSSAFQGCMFGASDFVNNSSLTSSNNWGATLVDRITPDGFCLQGTSLVAYKGAGGDIVVPDGTTEFGTNVFRANAKISSITLPEGITTIPDNAFNGCSSLAMLHLPSSILSIGRSTVEYCPALQAIDVADLKAWCEVSYKYSYDSPLYNAKRLTLKGEEITSLVVPEGLTSVPAYALCKCSKATSITIPASVTSIASNAFYGISIQRDRFYNYSTLDASAGKYWGATVYDEITSDGLCITNGEVRGYVGQGGRVVVPESVTSIGSNAFDYCSSITEVVLPSTLTSISTYAFRNCTSLRMITIPAGVSNLGGYAFYGCTSLEKVEILGSILYINNSTFASCTNLKSVFLPESVTVIGEAAFSGCKSLATVNIPNTVTTIRQNAFYGCGSLKSLIIPEATTTIEKEAFRGCCMQKDNFYNYSALAFSSAWGLTLYDTEADGFLLTGSTMVSYCGEGGDIVVPEGVTEIAERAFYNNKDITGIVFPYGVTTIGDYAFYGCTNLTAVKLPSSVVSIGISAFNGSGVKDAVVPASVSTYTTSMMLMPDPAFIPKGVTYVYRNVVNQAKTVVIEDGTGTVHFQDRNASDGYYPSALSSVKDLYIGNNLVAEGFSYAGELLNSSLQSITFGPMVTEALLNSYATRQCSNLARVTFLSKEPCLKTSVGRSGMVVMVPLGSKEAYSQAGWSGYMIREVENITIEHQNETETYTPDFDIDLTDVPQLEAYVADSYSAGKVNIRRVMQIRAGQGVILKGETGRYRVPCANLAAVEDEPLLRGTISGTLLTNLPDATSTVYYLAEDGMFRPASDYYSMALGRNKAFLTLPCRVDEVGMKIKPAAVEIVDGTEYNGEEKETYQTVTYRRSFATTDWEPLYVPLSLSYQDWADDLEVADIYFFHQYDTDGDGKMDETELEVTVLKEGQLEPNTPYLVRAKHAGECGINVSDATVYPAEENSIFCASTKETYTFQGTFSPVDAETLSGMMCYVMKDGDLLRADCQPDDLQPQRWYMTIQKRGVSRSLADAPLRIRVRTTEDYVDGIGEVGCNGKGSAVVPDLYDLQGRKMASATSKGIYIKAGQKVVLR